MLHIYVQTSFNDTQDGSPFLKSRGSSNRHNAMVELPKMAGYCCTLSTVLLEKRGEKSLALQKTVGKTYT